MRILIMVNESLNDMTLGSNASLAYILASVNLGFETYIYKLKKQLPINNNTKISAFYLDKGQKLVLELIKKYQKANNDISNAIDDVKKLQNIKSLKFVDNLPEKIITMSEIDFIIQRLEPMKSPFPPAGDQNIDQYLRQIRKIFPQFVFNYPINLSDKESPGKIEQILGQKIATPTANFNFEEQSFTIAFNKMAQEYQKLYKTRKIKLVVKPKDSAQSLGVFSCEFCENGLNLEQFKAKMQEKLQFLQSYQLKNDLSMAEIVKIMQFLCFIQAKKQQKTLKNLSKEQIIENLYGKTPLLQPFIEGVRFGDVRINLLKNQKGDFYVAGQVFRQNLAKKSSKFTTSYTSGDAMAQPIANLTLAEQKDLESKITKILGVINADLRVKYRNSLELGMDFMLIGNEKEVLLGEINHHCPALIPLAEAINKSAGGDDDSYKFGLGIVGKAIHDWISLQKGKLV